MAVVTFAARRVPLVDFEERPDIRGGVLAVKDNRLVAGGAQPEGDKFGLRVVGQVHVSRPGVAPNRRLLAKEHVVADERGGRSRGRTGRIGWTGFPAADGVNRLEDRKEGPDTSPVETVA